MDKLIMESKAEHFDTFDIYAEAIDRDFRKSMDRIDAFLDSLEGVSQQNNTNNVNNNK